MASQYPKLCPLCGDQIEAAFDEDYHGLDVCLDTEDHYEHDGEEPDDGVTN
jgi:hypothetical protein